MVKGRGLTRKSDKFYSILCCQLNNEMYYQGGSRGKLVAKPIIENLPWLLLSWHIDRRIVLYSYDYPLYEDILKDSALPLSLKRFASEGYQKNIEDRLRSVLPNKDSLTSTPNPRFQYFSKTKNKIPLRLIQV